MQPPAAPPATTTPADALGALAQFALVLAAYLVMAWLTSYGPAECPPPPAA